MITILAIYAAIGCAVGILAGLLGLGGGIVIVPVLLYSLPLFGVTDHVHHLAVGTSMASIIFTSLSSALAHFRRGSVHWDVVIKFTPGIIVGTLLGGTIAVMLPTRVLVGIFAVFLVYVGTQMLLNKKPEPSRHLPGTAPLVGVGGAIGMFSSFVGIGGGTLTIPFLTMCNVPMREAIGTSSGVGMSIAVFGSLSYIMNGWGVPDLPPWSFGFIYLPALLGLVIGSMTTAPLGAKLAYKVSVPTLKRFFAVFIFVVAANLVWKTFF
ncbi:sulfite exporter TauE/SafE family protein [Desulfovibrio sp. OttesenSCG-928-I05]|nr:sulfite exporter TauE/SafE family protein [Desulfovibrio sp. OttesenSCG-928-I05]